MHICKKKITMDIKQILADYENLQELAKDRALQEVIAKSQLDYTSKKSKLYVYSINADKDGFDVMFTNDHQDTEFCQMTIEKLEMTDGAWAKRIEVLTSVKVATLKKKLLAAIESKKQKDLAELARLQVLYAESLLKPH